MVQAVSDYKKNRDRADHIISQLDKGIDITKLNTENAAVLRMVRWHISDAQRLAERQLKQIDYAITEVTTDYEALVKNARKRFNDFDIVALQAMDDEYIWSADYFNDRYIEVTKKEGLTIAQARTRLRRLQRLGLIYLARGLFSEDSGMAAGSGWTHEQSKSGVIQRIVAVYTAENKQLSLEDY